ncbi:sacsin-like [Dysidea avara]|uniref:sacsin-like n=1 Tax=Dysidea avara TaxID=196820 RepID=UPI00332437A8
MAGSDEDGYFGQETPPLTDEIKEILEEYPDGQIFKEMLQNADDAKATEVKFFIDERSHGQHNLLHPSLAKFQGPALLAYNNAVFTDEDWTNIQKLKRSSKRSDPFKVGKFGIGFNSVFHITDVPAIISGKWLCFMDPQKRLWRGDPGHKYKLTNNTQQNSDSFSPFKFTDHCSLGTRQQYNGTLIRFPLRNEPSGLSNKLYTVAKLKELLKALKDDATILLLFLRYIERIEVFTINTSSIVSKIFSVEADRATENQRRQIKDAFLSEVEKYHSDSNSQLPRLQYEARITVHDVQLGTQSDYQWMIMHWVGSTDKDVIKASSKVSSLPWIGLAVPLTLQCSSRLFCFLPLPDSKEVNPPLPVCVHGTFGLNKDRRHLKWITSDMKNDDGALWNEVLLSKILPSCYAEFLILLKRKCKPEAFYSFWPHASVINNTNWKIILKPLLPLLLQGQYIWSGNGRWVGLDSSVCVVPQVNSSQFPKVVIDVLIRCGKTVVVLPDNVWDAVKFIHGSSYPFTTITPSVVRQAIRSNSQSYANSSRADKFHLLHYCLYDGNYHDLNGLILLPAVVSTFVAFSTNQSGVKMHVCDKKFLNTKLLANNSSTLVNVEGDDVSLHHKLIEVANSRCTQLQILTPESVAVLLKQTSPFQNGRCCYGSAGGFYNENWLKTFWSWVAVYSLSYFVNIPLVPVCGGRNSNGFKVVALTHRDYTRTFIYNRSTSLFYTGLVSGAEKFGCHLTCLDYSFLYHSELNNYVPQLSQSVLLSIAAQMNYQSTVFSQEEAKALKYFLFQHPVSIFLNAGQKLVAANLGIFTVLQTNKLTSLQNAKSYVGGNDAAMLVTEPDIISKYTFCLLPSPLIITCERDIVTNLQARLPGTCWVPTKLQLIVHVILLAVENIQLSRDHILKVTSTLLDPTEYYSLINTSGGQALANKLRSLKYLPTSKNSDLFSPCEVYDPMDHVVKELFEGQNVFPIAPFSSVHFPVLKQLGMKDCNTLSPSGVIRVTDIICNQTDTRAKVKRANNLLAFLSSPTGNRLLNEYYNNRPLDQTLRSLQWLPVNTAPPKGYPKCLGWKGSSSSQFVSAESLHVSSSPEEHKKLPHLIGSQMKILQYEGTLSVKLIASLNIPQSVPVNAMIQQLLDLINHKTEIEIAKFKSILTLLYTYLQRAAQSNVNSQYWQQLSQSEVVQVSDNKFVLPSVVACSFDEKCMTVGKLEPYWYILPSDLQQYRSLFCYVGAKDKVTVSDVLLIPETMSSSSNHNISFQQQFEVVNKVLKWLCNFTEHEIKRVYDKTSVPISTGDKNKLVLKPAKQVAFLDSDLNWVGDDSDDLGDVLEDYFLVHSSISYDMCCRLQLKPLNTVIANSEEICFEQGGQTEPLTTRLNRILREYKDTSVIQELLQNADDAGATEVAIYYDTRKHDSSRLFFPGMANSYGPALLFYNNAKFSEEDFEDIRKIAGETKVNKPLKIGKFGVGFCSVYHITDVPSFVSGEHLVVFDPTLQCLHKEIKSELNPGIKINFNKHRLLKKSNQLAPYAGVCGFNPKVPFQGTLFRFPLRSKGSKVSDNVYTEAMLLNMIEQVKENCSKLLMFLSNVKKISFHRSQGGSFTKDFEITTTKHKVQNNNDVVMCKVQVTTMSPSNQNKEDNWLIASKDKQLQQKHGTASVSVKVELSSSNQFCVVAVKGECFCFLPLNIETGLPVHVSSNFAVMTNRRGIWKADNVSTATKESNWNKALMESVVVQSYLMLLLHLQQMQQNGSLVEYTFHSLWPVTLREVNPWKLFVDKLYVDIFTSKHTLFFTEITTSWQRFNECKFLSDKILAIGFDNELHSSVYYVATVLKLPVVNLPNTLWDKLEKYANFKSQILDEEQFIKYFYNDETLSKISVQDKTKIVAASLIVYANNRNNKALPDLMKNTKCIPCSPDGYNFKYPHEVLNPASDITKLFSPEDGMFPDEAFLNSNSLIVTALSNLLMKSLSWELIIDRAKYVQTWYNQNSKEALNRLVILMDCINDNSSTEMPDGQTEQELQKIVFLPVMKKPNNYPISWKGDAVASLLSGPELIKASQDINSVNAVYACGSQVAILDTQFLPQQSHNLANRMLKVLGIKHEIEITNVIAHFTELLEWFQNCEIDKDVLSITNTITNSVYQYLARKLNTNSSDEVLLNGISSLTDKHCIWNAP